jgi:hypothetical protein
VALMVYLGASIVGFFGFIVATWSFMVAIHAGGSSETALMYLFAAGLVGSMLVPLLFWRWRSSPSNNGRWFIVVATALGFFVFAGASIFVVGGIVSDLTLEAVVAPMLFGGLVGGALAVAAVRWYQAKWDSQPE